MHIHTDDVCFCLRATMGPTKAPIVAIYDARGNGGGGALRRRLRETTKTE